MGQLVLSYSKLSYCGRTGFSMMTWSCIILLFRQELLLSFVKIFMLAVKKGYDLLFVGNGQCPMCFIGQKTDQC